MEGTSGAAERILFSRRDAGGGPPRRAPRKRLPRAGRRRQRRRLAGPFGTHCGDSSRRAAGRCDERCPRVDRVGVKLSPRAIAGREARAARPRGRAAPRKGPLTRETSAPGRWNVIRSRGWLIPCSWNRPGRGSSARVERPDSVARFRRSAVVLADRFGCRSRRAARGRERPGVKNARKRQGLALLLRERRAKERWKPDRGGEVPGSVAGLCPRAARESAASEQALVDGRRPGPSRSIAFDEAAGKAVLAAREASAERVVTGASGVDTLGPRAEENAARREAPPVSPHSRSRARQDRVVPANAGSAGA